ncbi:Cytochrome P450 4g1 [Trichinella spiralis]|uniref:Cytochrome P450 4g1 n=1 Tax=Trichinella spiralis TaxID=6334 RepID=A0ABR3KBG6_TRISP
MKPTCNTCFVPSIKPPPEAFKGHPVSTDSVPLTASASSSPILFFRWPFYLRFRLRGSILLSRGHCTVQAVLLAHSSWRHGIRLRVPAFSCLRPLTSTSVSAGIVIFSSTGIYWTIFGANDPPSQSRLLPAWIRIQRHPASANIAGTHLRPPEQGVVTQRCLDGTELHRHPIHLWSRFASVLACFRLCLSSPRVTLLALARLHAPDQLLQSDRPAAPLSGHAQDSSLGPRCQFSGNKGSLNTNVLVVRSSSSKPQSSDCCRAPSAATHIVQGTSRVDAYPDALSTRCFCLLGFLSFDVGDFEIRQLTSHQLFEYCLLPYINHRFAWSLLPLLKCQVVCFRALCQCSLRQKTITSSPFPGKGGGVLQNDVEWSSTGVTAVLCRIPSSSPFVTPGVTVTFGQNCTPRVPDMDRGPADPKNFWMEWIDNRFRFFTITPFWQSAGSKTKDQSAAMA